ncbi:MAG: MerR family DNA-binding protein, partial [Clostridium sp.]
IIDDKNYYRYYSQKHIIKVKAIIFLKKAGFSIEDIKEILKETNQKKIYSMLHKKADEIDKKIEECEKWRLALRNMKTRMKIAIEMEGEFKIRHNSTELVMVIFDDEFHSKACRSTGADASQHILCIDRDNFLNKNVISGAKFGVEVSEEMVEKLHKHNDNYEYHILKTDSKREYLFTHLITDYEREPLELVEKVTKWLTENNRKIDSDIICRFMGVLGPEEIYDIYEVWIPLKNY